MGPQVYKFEKASSDDHQMSVAGGRAFRSHVQGAGKVSRSHIWLKLQCMSLFQREYIREHIGTVVLSFGLE